ncbi:MAG: amidoligase family protein [Wenzhouxiangellaceae bacterium]|nr:amidoligase family protein [Wenzhouxiangellaceae bacterium]
MAQFADLPWTTTAEGAPRRVGVELEMAGLDAERIAEAVIEELGGEFQADSAFSGHVRGTTLGDFRVELDARVLTDRGYLDSLRRLGIDIEPGQTRDNLESLLSTVAGWVVPHELVCPPTPVDALPRIDAVRRRLHLAGAKGTQSSALYAFGLQFNIEVPGFEVDPLLAVLRAFFVEYDHILERESIDLARKLTPFVQPFPRDYVEYVLRPDYEPDLDTLIDDYLRFTPTRNRPLDALPLFAHIAPERVDAAPVEHELVKARPAWHYRLPNCRIDDPDWNLSEPWAEWVRVERLAASPERLSRRARRRLEEPGAVARWLGRVRDWLTGGGEPS